MSLLNQIIAAVFAVLIGLVSGTIYIMSDSSKSMLLNQLESHSHDTATHLSLYMAPYVAEQDSAGIETIVNAIFDSGYYEKISVTNYDKEDLYTALRSPEISQEVPNWFVKLIAFDSPNIEVEVVNAWSKVGFVVVKSRAGYAYEELWKGTQATLIWFITLSLVCVVFLSTLIRIILRPLKSIEEQALALSNREYIEVTNIPKTKELRSVVITMNSMMKRVKNMFEEQRKNIEELRKTAYIDELTGLANSRSILAQFSDKLDNRDDEGPQTLIYLRINDLPEVMRELTQENSNAIIKAIAGELQKISEKHIGSIIGRINETDLVVLFPLANQETASVEVNNLLSKCTQIVSSYSTASDDDLILHIATVFSTADTTAKEIIGAAKECIHQAEETGQKYIYKTLSSEATAASTEAWSKHVVESINNKKIYLQYQVTAETDTDRLIHKELLVRIRSQSGELCAAAKFISIVKALGLIETLDKAVVEHALAHINSSAFSDPIAINLSLETITNSDFKAWLTQQLQGIAINGKLSIEINESSILSDIASAIEFKQWLNMQGIDFGVDNFGVHPRGFSYLSSLHPNYVKIDGSLCKDVVDNAQDKFFLSSLVTAANSLSIPSYAERIEHQEQIEQLRKLGVVATQGFIHGQPKDLE